MNEINQLPEYTTVSLLYWAKIRHRGNCHSEDNCIEINVEK